MSASPDGPTTKDGHAELLPIALRLGLFLGEAMAGPASELVFPRPDGRMCSPKLKLDHVLRRALGRAGVLTGYIHKCWRHHCGFSGWPSRAPMIAGCAIRRDMADVRHHRDPYCGRSDRRQADSVDSRVGQTAGGVEGRWSAVHKRGTALARAKPGTIGSEAQGGSALCGCREVEAVIISGSQETTWAEDAMPASPMTDD